MMCVLVWHDVCAAKALVCGILCVREVDLYCRLFLSVNGFSLPVAMVGVRACGRGGLEEGLRLRG